VPIATGGHQFGPSNATLTIRTGRAGAAAKVGHDLTIEVSSWSATLRTGESDGRIELALEADSRSLRVLEGTGGIKGLSDDDKASIERTIDKDVLKGARIEFRSTEITQRDDRLSVTGELQLGGGRHPLSFELALVAGGRLAGAVTVRQSDFGIRPYSAMLGALRVADDVQVLVDAPAPA
jgi:polyisoprenoid-binding protein YceI